MFLSFSYPIFSSHFGSDKILSVAERKNGRALDWSMRLRIACGAARGLAYLHEDCKLPSYICKSLLNVFIEHSIVESPLGHPRIIHRDIKSSNILLDDKFEAQVDGLI